MEHFHTAQKRETYGKMIDTAMSSTQVVDGFMVKETAGAKETMAFLATMHKTLVKVYKVSSSRLPAPNHLLTTSLGPTPLHHS